MGFFDGVTDFWKNVGQGSKALFQGGEKKNTGSRPFGEYLPQHAGTYAPSQGGGGGFSEWLSGLPTPQQLAPLNVALQKTGIGPNIVPAMWTAFAPYGKSLIDRSALAKLRGTTAGIAGGRREFERSLLTAFQSSGVNPLFARGQLAESRPQVGTQIAAARGGIEADRQEQTFNLMAALQSALAESFNSDRSLGLSAYFGGKGLDASAQASKNALLASGIGALGSLFGTG